MSYDILLWGHAPDIHRIFVPLKQAFHAIYKLRALVSFRKRKIRIFTRCQRVTRQKHNNTTPISITERTYARGVCLARGTVGTGERVDATYAAGDEDAAGRDERRIVSIPANV
ncbi:hypothetical protein EVAR_61331_1 [Eumeta japonica]|uniref:Uncharacterized protein n=1 Tax=Eumeta variegata TaxID=151549 RepID=A0A4C1Y0Y7_EUMVA|nr:hypothetical protein EVAR_61331_1 [Eumeta japonica]